MLLRFKLVLKPERGVMGEVQDLLFDGQGMSSPAFDSVSKGSRTFAVIDQKIFAIGRTKDGAASSLDVKIFDQSLGKWLSPSVLGTGPASSSSHLAVLLNKDRILILKKDAVKDDSIWFLEVDTPFVREKKKNLVSEEVVAWSRGAQGDAPKPVVISGPSGVGKGTLISKLMEEFPSAFGFSISHTTRNPREKEIDGVHYHFSKRSIMEKDIRDGKFLESAHVHGNLYGTSIEAVEAVTDSGKRCILDIDVQGARSVKASSIEVVSIFICPPAFEQLEKRLRARGTETEEQVLKRLRSARDEIEQGKTSGFFDHIVVNDDLESCSTNLKKILGLAETVETLRSRLKNAGSLISDLMEEKGRKFLCSWKLLMLGRRLLNYTCYIFLHFRLSGGAPGRTRGLKACPIECFVEGMKHGTYADS